MVSTCREQFKVLFRERFRRSRLIGTIWQETTSLVACTISVASTLSLSHTLHESMSSDTQDNVGDKHESQKHL